MNTDPVVDPRLVAGVKLLERTGARSFELRFTEQEPTAWVAVGTWRMNRNGFPVPTGGKAHHECAAAMDPVEAVLRLCAQILDGGHCAHCRKPSSFLPDPGDLAPGLVCSYAWDPELETFRRGCEGDND